MLIRSVDAAEAAYGVPGIARVPESEDDVAAVVAAEACLDELVDFRERGTPGTLDEDALASAHRFKSRQQLSEGARSRFGKGATRSLGNPPNVIELDDDGVGLRVIAQARQTLESGHDSPSDSKTNEGPVRRG